MQGNQQIKRRWRRKPTQKLPFEAPHLLRNGPWSIRMRPPVLPYSLSSPAPLSEIRTGLSWCHELCSISRLGWSGAKSSVLGSRVLLRHRVLVHTCPHLWTPVQSSHGQQVRTLPSPVTIRAQGTCSRGRARQAQHCCAQNGHAQRYLGLFSETTLTRILTLPSAFPLSPWSASTQIIQYTWMRSGVKGLQRTEVRNY